MTRMRCTFVCIAAVALFMLFAPENASSQTIINQTTCVPTASPNNCLTGGFLESITVDCGAGDSIFNALASLKDRDGPNRILISGTCVQGLAVNGFNRLTFEGPATITRGWSFTNSRLITLRTLTFDLASAGGAGILLNGSHVNLVGTTIQNSSNTARALLVSGNSFVTAASPLNTITANAGAGVEVEAGSTLSAGNLTISQNGGQGILVRNGGSVRLGTPVDISFNAGPGIELVGGTLSTNAPSGSSFVEIHDNGAHGVELGNGIATLEGNVKIYNNQPGEAGPAQAFVGGGTLVFGSGSQVSGLITAFKGTVVLGSGDPMTHTGGVQLLAGSIGAVVAGSTVDQMTCDATSWASTLFGAGTITLNNCPLDAPTGTQGPTGPQGAPGISGYEIVSNPVAQTIAKDAETTVSTPCAAGKSVIGGGVAVTTLDFLVLSSVPETSPQQRWTARIRSAKNTTGTITVHAICAFVQ